MLGRIQRHNGVSTMTRYGLGFWDSFSDVGDISNFDAVPNDFVDMGDFSYPIADEFQFDTSVIVDNIVTTDEFYTGAPVTIDGESSTVTPWDSDDAEKFPSGGSVQTAWPSATATKPVVRAPSAPEKSVLQQLIAAGPGAIDAATKLLRTQQQIDLAKAALNRGAIPLGYTLNAQGQLVPVGGLFDKISAYVRDNPVPVMFAVVGLAISLSRGK